MNKIKHLYPFLLLWFLPFTGALPQSVSLHHSRLKFQYEDSLLKIPYFHSALQPVRISVGDLVSDNKILQQSGSFTNISETRNFYIAPVLDALGGFNQNTGSFSYSFAQGAFMAGNLGKRAGFELSAVLYQQKFPGESYSIDSLKVVPRHNGYIWGKGEQAVYPVVRGNIWWKANRWLTFTAGNDKHFIGDGQRSLLLSENAAAYPFFQTRLNIWKINYIHQVNVMRDIVAGAGSKRFPKYSSQHTLSMNISPRLNFYVFETVVWRKQDSARHRGLDLTYLNPFLFFRPAEFNQGSPDNVIMGLGGKLRVFGKTYLYGQFLLDEFNLKFVSKNQGWWGSKYGYQAGFKSLGLFKDKKSIVMMEYLQMRPFTYSHSYTLQNYGYLHQPLAHPLGSNFRELNGVLRIALSAKWLIHATGLFQRYGTDPPGLNYGSDIYKRQWTFSKYYDNYIGQGVLQTLVQGEVEVNRILVPAWRMTAFANIGMLMHKVSADKEIFPSFSLGIKTLLYD